MIENTHDERRLMIQKKIRREVFWQITLPLLVGILLILALAAWTIFTVVQVGSVRQAADTSLVFLLIPTMAMALIPLVLLAGLAYGVIWMNQNFPAYLHQAQGAFDQVREGVRRGADKLVEPVLKFKSNIAALEVLRRKS